MHGPSDALGLSVCGTDPLATRGYPLEGAVACTDERAWLWARVEQAPQAWFEARRISRLKIDGPPQALGPKSLLEGEKLNCRQTCFGKTTLMRIKPQTFLWSTGQRNIRVANYIFFFRDSMLSSTIAIHCTEFCFAANFLQSCFGI